MSDIQVASHLLQFIFLSDSGFRFPLAHFPTTQCPPSSLYFQFWEGVLRMKQAGFRYVQQHNKYCSFVQYRYSIKFKIYSKLCIFYSFILFSIYYCICDGGDANRQFIKINFPNCSPIDLHFIGYNMWTEDPMIFQMDCKVIGVYDVCIMLIVWFKSDFLS